MTFAFTDEPLFHISLVLERALTHGRVSCEVLDPDVSEDLFSGETLVVEGVTFRYRTLSDWVELAEGLDAVLETPEKVATDRIRLSFRPLRQEESWHQSSRPSGDTEKYGVDTPSNSLNSLSSIYSYISK